VQPGLVGTSTQQLTLANLVAITDIIDNNGISYTQVRAAAQRAFSRSAPLSLLPRRYPKCIDSHFPEPTFPLPHFPLIFRRAAALRELHVGQPHHLRFRASERARSGRTLCCPREERRRRWGSTGEQRAHFRRRRNLHCAARHWRCGEGNGRPLNHD
jgi:hypothetical protein